MNPFWQLERFGESVAVVAADGSTISYQELALQADKKAAIWVKPNSLFFLHAANSIPFLINYLAVLRHGHVAMLLPDDMTREQRDVLAGVYYPEWIINADGTSSEGSGSDIPVDQQAALLLSTSGTTGTPKQVCLSRDNLQSNASAIAQYLGIDANEHPITTLPPHYSYGLSVINSHLLVGAKIVMTNDALITKDFWSLFKREQCTSLAGVPTTYEMLRRLRLERMELPSMATLTQAGGRLAVDHVKFFADLAQQRAWRFFVMYGQTEATARMAYLPAEMVFDHPECIGKAIPGGSLHLVDDYGKLIEKDEVEGQLVYKGANVMLGYVENRGNLSELSPLIELHTGDLAVRHKQGLYQITGRIKRFIKLHGHRISLDEVERLLEKQFSQRVLCGGRDQMLIVAHLPSLEQEKIKHAICAIPNVNASDIRILELKEWPVSASGKIAYDQLTEMTSNG